MDETSKSEAKKPIAMEPLDLAALLCSRVCHDAVGPVGAIVNGLEFLDEDQDEATRVFALDLIRKSARQVSARLQFARIAFGAAGSAGSAIDLGDAHGLVAAFVQDEKVSLEWSVPRLLVEKNRVKLLMNLVVIAMTALPRGGVIHVGFDGDADRPNFSLTAAGLNARVGAHVPSLLQGVSETGGVDAHGFQVFYTGLIARAAGMEVMIEAGEDAVRLLARPV